MPSTDDDTTQRPSEVVHVWFPMSGGPASAMSTPAEMLEPDRVRLLYAPWAAVNAAKSDVYRVRKEDGGQLWAQEKLEASGFCAIRLFLTDDGPFQAIHDGVEAAVRI